MFDETRKIKVCITETLERVVEVEAASEAEAIRIVKKQYHDEEIILSADDHTNTEFGIFK